MYSVVLFGSSRTSPCRSCQGSRVGSNRPRSRDDSPESNLFLKLVIAGSSAGLRGLYSVIEAHFVLEGTHEPLNLFGNKGPLGRTTQVRGECLVEVTLGEPFPGSFQNHGELLGTNQKHGFESR